jgi:hypothetical protein
MASTSLRDLVANRIGRKWIDWSQVHPHLAEVIDQTRLVDATIQRLLHDPQFVQAMRQADIDEAKLEAASRLLERMDGLLDQMLPM